MSEMLSLAGQGAVVTGGAQGIGAAVARRLADAGAGVLLLDLNQEQVHKKAEEIAAESGAKVLGMKVDVTDAKQMQSGAIKAKESFGSLDIWVNNAGIFPSQDPIAVSKEDFAHVIDVNLLGVQLGCQAAVSQMKEGVIVNIASTAAFHYAGAYSASKWALRGLTKGLAVSLGPDIRIVAVAPTVVRTPGVEELEKNPESRKQIQSLVESLPLGREGTPDDIARAVLFLASPAASFITGITLPVDGGELAL